jgi:hypothetical protein
MAVSYKRKIKLTRGSTTILKIYFIVSEQWLDLFRCSTSQNVHSVWMYVRMRYRNLLKMMCYTVFSLKTYAI